MKLGVGLPSAVAGVTRADLLAWASRADALGFASLAATDRLAFADYEPLVTLAAAAAVTDRIELIANILVVPQRGSAGALAKQLATLDELSGGRLTVGVGVGDRERDYRIAGAEMRGRHARLDEMLDEMAAIWRGADVERGSVGPRLPAGRPPLLIGGRTEATFARAARHGAGWTMALGTPERFESGIAALRKAWADRGLAGSPRGVASLYFGLGAAADVSVGEYLRAYFAFLGPYVDEVASFTPTDADALLERLAAFERVGADDLILITTTAELDELERLARLVL
jgi:alkanesulfonate monooxygenase SsuD/methylene tetrahydromethanopterin reductase-like flavin-dependent oxidoreductase (luciferase family)